MLGDLNVAVQVYVRRGDVITVAVRVVALHYIQHQFVQEPVLVLNIYQRTRLYVEMFSLIKYY